MGVFGKFHDTAVAIGLWNAVLFAASRVLSVLFRGRVRLYKYYITVQPVPEPAAQRAARSGAFEIEWAHPGCPLFAQVERPPAVIAARFAQGARCIVASRQERLAGFLWFVVGPYEEDEVRARFVPGPAGSAAWDFDVLVLPEYRMGRLFSYMWNRAAAEMWALGVRNTLSRVSAFNAASVASHRRLGARIVASALFVCLGRWQLMRATVAPHWHFSRRVDSRPTLAIEAD